MSKSKKNTKNDQHNTKDCNNNMSYAQDKKSDKTSDCHNDKAQNKSESNCR